MLRSRAVSVVAEQFWDAHGAALHQAGLRARGGIPEGCGILPTRRRDDPDRRQRRHQEHWWSTCPRTASATPCGGCAVRRGEWWAAPALSGVVGALRRPLRTAVRRWDCDSRGRRRRRPAGRRRGGALGDCAREFLAAPDTMLLSDRFRPSAAGYELASRPLTPALAEALGEWQGGPVPTPPERSQTADRSRLSARALAATTRFLRRHDHAAPVRQLLDAADTGPHRSGAARAI